MKQKVLEDARNSVRTLLWITNPVAFPYKTFGIDISDLFVYMLTGKSIRKLTYNCIECNTALTCTTKVTSLFIQLTCS